MMVEKRHRYGQGPAPIKKQRSDGNGHTVYAATGLHPERRKQIEKALKAARAFPSNSATSV